MLELRFLEARGVPSVADPLVDCAATSSTKGPSIRYVRSKMAIFEPPTHPCTQKYALALPPTPPLYKRILEKDFQNTMNVKKSKNINQTNP